MSGWGDNIQVRVTTKEAIWLDLLSGSVGVSAYVRKLIQREIAQLEEKMATTTGVQP